MIKIEVDLSACDGNGDCEDLLPRVFRVGEGGVVELLVDQVGDELADELAEAVQCCPTRAITIGG